MKKLVFVFAFLALAAVQANAQTVTLMKGNAQDLLITEAGQTYIVTPVSGGLNVTGIIDCDGSGCTDGFEFTYTVDPTGTGSGGTTVTTDKFSTQAAAFAAAQSITFTALQASAEIFLDCGGCSNAVGSITLESLLLIVLNTPDNSFSADDLVNLAFELPSTFEIGPDETFSLFDTDNSLFDTVESIFEIASECTGPACTERDTTLLDPLLISLSSENLEKYIRNIEADEESALRDKMFYPQVGALLDQLVKALGDQNQIDMNNGIESVIPELAGIIVL